MWPTNGFFFKPPFSSSIKLISQHINDINRQVHSDCQVLCQVFKGPNIKIKNESINANYQLD